MEQPTRGDWASTCLKNLSDLCIKESLEEIRLMTKQRFKKILKLKINEAALKYLLEKRKSKGKEIEYKSIQMEEYLLPSNSVLTIEQKRNMFAVKNRMVDIPANFPNEYKKTTFCCNEIETMKHLYICEELCNEKSELEYEQLYHGNIHEQV